jgi:hypothetical protein
MLCGVTVAGLTVAVAASRGQTPVQFAQDAGPGPVTQPATLRMPWETSPAATPGLTTPGATTPGMPAFLGGNSAASLKPIPPFQEAPDPNKDIAVSNENGPWMICVHWYSGNEAPQRARKMVLELRDNYKLKAFVFNKGADERRQEYERLKATVEKQRAFLIQNNLPPVHTHLKTRRIEEQCAILVGNYPDADAARQALNKIRELKPDPKRVDLSIIFQRIHDDKGNVNFEEAAYVNPFTTAFVVHNPLLKIERPAEWQKQDMEILRKLNRGESYSLFNCKKPYTLMVKQFLLPSVIQSKSAGGKFLESIGIGKSTNSDNVALNAHNMAELFRKIQLDGYVLHTRYSSIVTVGAFDSAEDPSLKSTQDLLATRLKIPQAVPMAVPR